jgi:hypothetical protein
MELSKHVSALALASLIGIATPFAAVAQTQPSAPAVEEVSSDEIDAFVAAYEDVITIDAEYAEQMAQTTDQAALEGLQQEIQTQKSEAVEATEGMDVDRYFQILTIAQADPSLSAQIVEKLEQ